MDIDLLLFKISNKYNINFDELIKIKNESITGEIELTSTNKNSNIILPFCNYIYKNNCKAIIFNHGLFTQCNEKCDDICKKCSKKILYGRIEDRLKYLKDEFVTKNGKKEVPYEVFMKKQNYKIEDVKMALRKEGLTYEFNNDHTKLQKNSRGRPKKNIMTNDERATNNLQINESEEKSIEVSEIEIDNVVYYLTSENVLLNRESKEIVGLYKDKKEVRLVE